MALTFFKPWIRASKKKQTDEEEEESNILNCDHTDWD